MIIEFSVQNHRSIKSEQRLSFVASNYDKSLPDNIITLNLPGLGELKLVKAIALYGPNAGGKSNAFDALNLMRWLAIESASGQKPEAKLPVTPFALDGSSQTQPTFLSLAFIVGGIRYELSIALTQARIVQERLVAYPTGKAQVWYDRVWDDEKTQYDWNPALLAEFQLDPGLIQRTRENATFLSTAAQWNDAKIKPIYQWFESKLRFLELGANGTLSKDLTAKLVDASDEFKRNVSKLLRTADLGLIDVEAFPHPLKGDFEKVLLAYNNFRRVAGVEEDDISKPLWKVKFRHSGQKGESFSLDWSEQSAGTQRYFSLLGPWLIAGALGYVICVDELETSLHPMLALELIRLLMHPQPETVPTQLFFTTHNPLLLDQTLLRRDQVWFADKDDTGATFLYPLTDYKPRADESLVRGYLSGRYGAVPFIPNGLLGEYPAEDKTPATPHAS